MFVANTSVSRAALRRTLVTASLGPQTLARASVSEIASAALTRVFDKRREPHNWGMSSTQRPGRPANSTLNGAVDRKQAIADAASLSFNSLGYDKTTIRLIAKAAGVDPKLVVHYFGTKADLFASTFSMPGRADDILAALTSIPRSEWGTVVAGMLINDRHQIEGSSGASGAGLIVAATTHPEGSSIIRDVVAKNSLGPFLASIGVDNPTLRASTLESLLLGMVFSDYILEIPPVPETEFLRRRALLSELIQTILTCDLR